MTQNEIYAELELQALEEREAEGVVLPSDEDPTVDEDNKLEEDAD